MKSIKFKDKYSAFKEWEIIKLNGGYYLKQYIKGKQFGRGFKTSKKWIEKTLEIELEYNDDKGLIVLRKNKVKPNIKNLANIKNLKCDKCGSIAEIMSEDKDWIVCSCDFCGADFVIYKDTGKKEYLIVTGDNRDKINKKWEEIW